MVDYNDMTMSELDLEYKEKFDLLSKSKDQEEVEAIQSYLILINKGLDAILKNSCEVYETTEEIMDNGTYIIAKD